MSNIRKFSSIVTDGHDRAPSRAMLRAVGFKDEDFKKPQIGIASTQTSSKPCTAFPAASEAIISALARDAACVTAWTRVAWWRHTLHQPTPTDIPSNSAPEAALVTLIPLKNSNRAAPMAPIPNEVHHKNEIRVGCTSLLP